MKKTDRLLQLEAAEKAHLSALHRHSGDLSELQRVQEAHQSDLGEIASVLEAHQETIDQHASQLDVQGARLDELVKDVSAHREAHEKLDKLIDEYDYALGVHSGALDADKVMISAMQAVAAGHGKRIASLDDEKDALWARYNYLSGEVEKQERRSDQDDGAMSRLIKRIEELEAWQAEAKRAMSKMTATIGVLTMTALVAADHVTTSKKQIADLEQAITDLRNENRTKSERLSDQAVRLYKLEGVVNMLASNHSEVEP